MESKVCTNGLCGATASPEWKKGWRLRSGEFADLCDKCGSSYEQLIFCETFHLNDSGWRDCSFCGKRLHCGCVASSSLIELMDGGGVICIGCTKDTRHHSFPNEEQLKGGISLKELLPYGNSVASNEGQGNEEVLLPPPTMSLSVGSSQIGKVNAGIKEIYESLAQTSLTIALASPSPATNPNSFHGLVEERVAEKTNSSLQQLPKSRHLFPRLPKSIHSAEMEANAAMAQPIRVARPPAEGRVKNQLLPRYWPRITDQELQEISGDSNSTIVPLFEKVLSASDAGRIGRLVLPKACAEAYFPPISQPEGLPLRIQDVKGKEWVFQFRFWPNNNSRMYVLEGVTPCIQSMQLQAGDTVTFSRMDPDGKLLMGFRRSTNSTASQSTKDSFDPHYTHSKQMNSATGDFSWLVMEKNGTDIREGLMSSLMHVPERKRNRNLGPKSKRLLIDSTDALELKLTWEEAQDILQPPNSLKPTIVTIDDNEFEEYDEPPVFGKASIFTVSMSGEQWQWTQCDMCSKWRRVSADYLLPPKWTCLDNIWDQSRSSCSAPDELNPKEVENLLRQYKEFKKRRIATSQRLMQEQSSPGDPSAAVGGEESSDAGAELVATTTKHPRHRPGCSCIVCIQPPSGKGKHKPTCTCNVCMTVKRRFNTLMMRKKKRQSEREAEIALRSQFDPDVYLPPVPPPPPPAVVVNREEAATNESGVKGRLDLNSNPERDGRCGIGRVSMRSLLEAANQPLENYLRQNGLSSLASDRPPPPALQQQQLSSGSSRSMLEATGESDGNQQTRNDDEERCSPEP